DEGPAAVGRGHAADHVDAGVADEPSAGPPVGAALGRAGDGDDGGSCLPGFVHVFPLERQFVISFLSGTVHRIAADHFVVLTYGVGRKVHVTPETLASTRHGAEIELVTSLVVREDSLTLYGFGTEDENHT